MNNCKDKEKMLNKEWKKFQITSTKSQINSNIQIQNKPLTSVLNIWGLIFGIVWQLVFRVWNLSPQDVEQICPGGCRVAWSILRRSGRRDLSSNLSNPILALYNNT